VRKDLIRVYQPDRPRDDDLMKSPEAKTGAEVLEEIFMEMPEITVQENPIRNLRIHNVYLTDFIHYRIKAIANF